MKISETQFNDALLALIEGSDAEPGRESARLVPGLYQALDSLGIEVVSDECQCSTTVRVYCHAKNCHGGSEVEKSVDMLAPFEDVFTWPAATWADVRQGDVVRATEGAKEGMIVKIGPVSTRAQSGARFRHVELLSIEGHRAVPPHGMNPAATVQIRVTRRELAAIELLGGWANRVSAAQPG